MENGGLGPVARVAVHAGLRFQQGVVEDGGQAYRQGGSQGEAHHGRESNNAARPHARCTSSPRKRSLGGRAPSGYCQTRTDRYLTGRTFSGPPAEPPTLSLNHIPEEVLAFVENPVERGGPQPDDIDKAGGQGEARATNAGHAAAALGLRQPDQHGHERGLACHIDHWSRRHEQHAGGAWNRASRRRRTSIAGPGRTLGALVL